MKIVPYDPFHTPQWSLHLPNHSHGFVPYQLFYWLREFNAYVHRNFNHYLLRYQWILYEVHWRQNISSFVRFYSIVLAPTRRCWGLVWPGCTRVSISVCGELDAFHPHRLIILNKDSCIYIIVHSWQQTLLSIIIHHQNLLKFCCNIWEEVIAISGLYWSQNISLMKRHDYFLMNIYWLHLWNNK